MDEITIRRTCTLFEPMRTPGGTMETGSGAATGDFTSATAAATSRAPMSRAVRRRDGSSAMALPETRAALRSRWNAAKAAAAALVETAGRADRMGLLLAADKLDATLGGLWELRTERDLDWRTILNHAQGMMRQLFVEKRVEALTLDQCKSIHTLVAHCLGPATKSSDDLNEAVRLIGDAGCDPYAALSGDPEGEQEKPHP